ncbi:malate synthase A [Chitinilyticum piscinae]|uniref:Malate synthase n=1 Tax=Chitinilyticum piscinae TaxID=2866724 RepID=A0A8J7FQE3_9NEIS|nr:malate synthase A [Chitinilyticum piscinae]MBE9610364.1 malate synthase A [Chitinilyticum piscinae]
MNNIPVGVLTPLAADSSQANILSQDALYFLSQLHRKFEPKRRELLAARAERQARLDAGETPDYLPETADIRSGNWSIAPLPPDLLDRRVEITGPVERKMMINALNSGAKSFMADFEDSNTPTWQNQIEGQQNIIDAYRRTLGYTSPEGKEYRLNPQIATLVLRPRGWHLDEKHVTVDGEIMSGSLFDFGLAAFHNLRYQVEHGSSCYFYLPKMESHLEARLWNDVFTFTESFLGVPHGIIKGTVLIETILAAFEMDEILYELRDHSAGLNAGRWDYIFSCIKKFRRREGFCLAERSKITMTVPFMRAYSLLLLKTCHRRNAPAMGGMSAYIPVRSDPAANEKALAQVKSDKERDAGDGYDGGWVAHPGLVPVAMAAWDAVLGDKPNQITKQRDDVTVRASDLLDFQPETPISEAGLRNNISVGIQYLASWLTGQGCVPIHNLMEDAATAEISRSQIWQWLRSSKGVLDDGRKVDVALFKALLPEEVASIRASGKYSATLDEAARLFDQITTAEEFVEFLTLPGYARLA